MSDDENHVEFYGDSKIVSANAKVPLWLKITYVTVIVWGFFCLYFFWNGSYNDWFDRGYWGQLQRAANTKYPFKDADLP